MGRSPTSRVVPPQVASKATADVDGSFLLAAAGVDPKSAQPAAPRRTAPFGSDRRSSWRSTASRRPLLEGEA
jgi:hypothetical protein